MPDLDSYVKLMCHFNGADGSTTIVDDYSDKTITANGNAQLKTLGGVSPKFGSAAFLSDGNGDYAKIPSHSDFNYGTGAFTVDFWFNLSSIGRTNTLYSHGGSGEGLMVGGTINVTSANKLNYYCGGQHILGSTTVVIDTWYHVAFVGNGGADGSRTLKLYLDGVLQGTTTYNYNFAQRDIYVGANEDATNECISGLIDEFRISKGVERWTTDFTPPTSAHTSDSYTKALLHFDGSNNSTTFTDSGNTGHTISAQGNAKLSTGTAFAPKFGSAMCYFDGTGDYLSIADNSDFAFGSGDFTIDCQIRLSVLPSSGNYACIFSQSNAANSQNSLGLFVRNNGGTYMLQASFSYDGTTEKTLGANYAFSAGQWYHIAIVRSTTQISLFVDGVFLNNYSISTNSLHNSTAEFKIGASYSTPTNFFNGCIDEFRVSNGIARWGITPSIPSSAYTTDSYTKLLLHCDGSDDSTTFTDDSGTSKTVTANGNAKLKTSGGVSPKFGTAMLSCDGNGDYAKADSHADFNYGTGAFSVDFWFSLSSVGRSHILYSHGGSNESIMIGGVVFVSSGNKLGYYCGGQHIIGSTNLSANTWYHVSFEGNGGADGSRTLKLYLNGVQEGPTTTYNYNFAQRDIYVGANEDSVSECLLGYIDEFRVSKGIARFNPASFTPPSAEYDMGITTPIVTTTDPIPQAKDYSAVVSGEVTSDGNATITERGFCYATTPTPTTSSAKITVSGTTGTFSGEIFGLALETTYHVRAYAINSVGTGYGDDVDFTTTNSAVAPSTTTVTPLIQILDYDNTYTATASTTSATILFATTAGMSEDDFIVNTTRNNTSRRVDDIPSAGVHTLNATIPNQAQGDSIRVYKFTDHTSQIKQETLNFSERIEGGGDLSFQMVTDGTYIPRAGQYIRLNLNSQLYFTGVINSVVRKLPQDGITEKMFFDVSATQLKIIPPRRTITVNYDIDTTCSTIVSDVVNNYLVDEGFMAGTVNDGVKLAEQWLDDCISIGDILDQCANLSGYQWYVDENFDLQFMQDPTMVSTCTYVISDLTNSFTDYRNVTVEETIDNYTNKVFIAGGNDQNGNLVLVGQQTTASILEMQDYSAGSGVWGKVERNSGMNKADYEVAEAGTTASTVVLGTATMASHSITVGHEIYNITQGIRSTVASVTVTSFELLTAIAGQTAGDTIVVYDDANSMAKNILKRQDQVPKVISFDTFTLGFRAGQKLQVALSSLSMSTTASYVVDEVGIRHIGTDYFKSTIRAILRNESNFSTQKNPDAWDFYKNLGASANTRPGFGVQRGAINPKVTVSGTTPSNPKISDIFVKTSPTPSVQYWWDGFMWQQ